MIPHHCRITVVVATLPLRVKIPHGPPSIEGLMESETPVSSYLLHAVQFKPAGLACYCSPINPLNFPLIMPIIAELIASQESPIMGARYISGIVISTG